jgi:hypothetical protein
MFTSLTASKEDARASEWLRASAARWHHRARRKQECRSTRERHWNGVMFRSPPFERLASTGMVEQARLPPKRDLADAI